MAQQLLAETFGKLVALSPATREVVNSLPYTKHSFRRRLDILKRGQFPSSLYVLLDGWAGRYSLRPDRSRRITGIMLPGDFCGIHASCLAPMDHSITALTDCTFAFIQASEVDKAAETLPEISRALWQAKRVEEAILRMWLLNSSDAYRSLAHLICELEARLGGGASVLARRITFPITQEDVGDALGITSIHVNRTLRSLSDAGLIQARRGEVDIPNIEALRTVAKFDPSYLSVWGRAPWPASY